MESTTDAARIATDGGTPAGDDGVPAAGRDGGTAGGFGGALTVVAAVLAGAVVGVLALFALVFPFGEWGVAGAVAVWLAATVHLLRRPNVYEVGRYGAYGVAVALIALPAGLLLGTTADPATRITALVLYEFVAGTFALGVAAMGYVAGEAAPEPTA